jgi:lipoate-protein ligase B
MAYRSAQCLQERLLLERPHWNFDLLMLLQHDPVVTAGRAANLKNLIRSPDQLAAAGIDYVETRRGGDVTYHGPGQLVGYPLLDLAVCRHNLHLYLRNLEELLILALARFSLEGRTLEGKTGVWIGDRKIASIGVAVRRWISWHGFALNVDNDLAGFDAIVPCGLQDVKMTSMQAELRSEVDFDEVTGCIIATFSEVFGLPCLGDFDNRTTE